MIWYWFTMFAIVFGSTVVLFYSWTHHYGWLMKQNCTNCRMQELHSNVCILAPIFVVMTSLQHRELNLPSPCSRLWHGSTTHVPQLDHRESQTALVAKVALSNAGCPIRPGGTFKALSQTWWNIKKMRNKKRADRAIVECCQMHVSFPF